MRGIWEAKCEQGRRMKPILSVNMSYKSLGCKDGIIKLMCNWNKDTMKN